MAKLTKAQTEMLDAWDRLDNAIDGIITALPERMSAAADRLGDRRLEFREMIRDYMFSVVQQAEDDRQ